MKSAQYPTSAIPDPPPPETPILEDDGEVYDDEHHELIPKPIISEVFPKLLSLLADLIYNCMSTLSAPIFSLLNVATESYHQAEEAKYTVESAVHKVPSTITHGSAVLLKKLGFGFLGAAYVCMVLFMLLILAGLFGVGWVNLWVEEPVFVRERLHFDYTEPNPTAVFAFGTRGGSGINYFHKRSHSRPKRMGGVPVGHTFYVSLVLLMPESDFNRGMGIFQTSAEVISGNGEVIAKSGQPCMLRFQSLPVRLTRTFLMGVPLLLGISAETQKIEIPILKHKEGHYPRTQAIRVTLSPRAGTTYLPQLYEAEIVINSQLPWTKQLVHNWKWTLYVWTSLYVYVMFLIVLIFCSKSLFLPITMMATGSGTTSAAANVAEPTYTRRGSAASEAPRPPKDSQATSRDRESDDDVQELLRRWQRRRSKRKAIYLQAGDLNVPAVAEAVGSSSAASTISITRDDASVAAAEDVGDSESVCS